MDSTNSNTIKVTLKPHPIKTYSVLKIVERKTYREIFESLNLPLTIEYAFIYDGENIIVPELYDEIPEEDHIYIRLIPQGGVVEAVGDFFTDVGEAIVEGLQEFFGFIWEKTAGFFAWLFGGPERTKPLRSPSIRGSSNPTLKGQRLPILLGKHLVFPAHASSPYTTNVFYENHKNRPRYPDRQRVFQLFCGGTKSMVVNTASAKVGDTLTSNIPQAQVNFLQAGEATSLYGDRHFMTPVNKEVEANNQDDNDVIVLTTPTNTETIRLNFIAQSGVGAPEDNALNKITVGDVVFIKDVDSAGAFVQAGRYEDSAASYHTYRWEHVFSDPNSIAASTKRQWTLKIVRSHRMDPDSNRRDRFSLESMVCTTADFASNPVDRKPISDTTRAKLTIIETRFNASNLIKGTVENFNFEATLSTYIYSGSGTGPTQWTTQAATQNPAACFLYMLRDSYANEFPATDDQIDWPSVEAWYTFCNTNSFECNLYFNDDTTIKQILEEICRLGRASWTMIDGKFSVIIDRATTSIIQYFTPRNSSNFTGRRAFSDVITCCRVKFTNPLVGYEEAERLVYSDTYTGPLRPTDIVQDLDIPGAITPDQAYAMGRYLLASNQLRPEQFSFDADIEYIFCTRGDRIQLNHDVPLLGLGSGRVASVETSGGNTVSLTSDELLTYEHGKNYGVKVRKFDGTLAEIDVQNQASATETTVTSYALEFVTPESGTTNYSGDELFMFGERDSETLDLLVMHIQPNNDLSATLVCVEYNESVYDTGTIPAYNPKISIPGDSGGPINVTNTPSLDDYTAVNNSDAAITAQLADMVNRSLTAYVQDGDQQLEITGFKPLFLDANSFAYINYNDGNKIYRKTITDSQNTAGTEIVSNAAEHMLLLGIDDLIYVNQADSSKLYVKDLQVSGNGTALTTVTATNPITDNEGTIFYINRDDMSTLYSTTLDDANGTQLTTFPVQFIAHNGNGEIIYVNPSNGNVYKKNDNDGNAGSLLMSTTRGVHGLMHLSDTHYLYISNYDHTLYRNTYANTVTTDPGEALFEIVSSASGFHGNILFSTQRPNLEQPGVIYYSGVNRARREPQIVLKPQVDTTQFRADMVNGSFYIRNIPLETINVITVNDFITGTGIPENARVRYVGTNYLSMSFAATATSTNVLLQTYGDRLYIDTNKVIASGSIEARHLRASAIDSKAYATNGERISEYNLDTGTVQIRKQDGTTVYDFDPNRANNELLFSGKITATAVGTDNEKLPTATDLAQIGGIVRQQADGEITITISNTAPTEPDTGDLWQDTSTTAALIYSWSGSSWVNASSNEKAAFEYARANNALIDQTAQIFSSTVTPSDYRTNDIWIRNIRNITYKAAVNDGTTYIGADFMQLDPSYAIPDDILTTINSQTDKYITYTRGTTEPASPSSGDLWRDTTQTIAVNKIYSGTAFIMASNGYDDLFSGAEVSTSTTTKKIFASDQNPSNYSIGDIWIRAGSLTTASYLATQESATFSENHWNKNETDEIGRSRLASHAVQSVMRTTENPSNPIYDLNLDNGRRIVRQTSGTIVIDENPEAGTFAFKGDITGATGRFSSIIGTETTLGTGQAFTDFSATLSNYTGIVIFSSAVPNASPPARSAALYFMTVTPNAGPVTGLTVNRLGGNLTSSLSISIASGPVSTVRFFIPASAVTDGAVYKMTTLRIFS